MTPSSPSKKAATSEEAKKLKRTLEYELCRDLGAGDAAAVLIDRCLKDARRQAYENVLGIKLGVWNPPFGDVEMQNAYRRGVCEWKERFEVAIRALAAGEEL